MTHQRNVLGELVERVGVTVSKENAISGVLRAIRERQRAERNSRMFAVVKSALVVSYVMARTRPPHALLGNALLTIRQRSQAIVVQTAALAHIHKIQLVIRAFLQI